MSAQDTSAELKAPAPLAPVESWLAVETNAPEAELRIDGVRVGTAGEGPYTVAPGYVSVELVERTEASWSPRRASVEVEVAEGGTTEVDLRLPLRYRIETFPVGASVSIERDGETLALGPSPVLLDRDGPLRGTLVAEASGFMPARAAPGDSLTNRVTLVLQPLEDSARPVTAGGWVPDRRPNRFIDYALGATAVAAAVVAVHYKFQADEVDDRYRLAGSAERGDPVLKAEAERLDVYSLAALGVMQASVAVLAIRFVIR